MKSKIKEKIIFDKSAVIEILNFFGKSIDKDNYIIEANSQKRVLSFDGEYIRMQEFAGIMKGSELYIKSDIDSIVKFLKRTP